MGLQPMLGSRLRIGVLGALLGVSVSARALAVEPEEDSGWGIEASPSPSTAPDTAPAAAPEPSAALSLTGTAPSDGDPMADAAETPAPGAGGERAVEKRVLHGFRLGYLHIMNYDKRVPAADGSCDRCSLKERYDLRTPHQFLLGYEVMGRLVGHGWLNVLLVGNVLVSGLEQSKFLPSANFLIGFELDQSFQVGVGTNLTLEREKPAHMVLAAGWTPKVGSFYVPVHAFFVPDVDENHRTGMTVGVNW